LNGGNHIFKKDIDVLTDFMHKVREKSKEFSNKFDLFIKIPEFYDINFKI